jgi:phosphatidylglycerophosphate synthase
VLDFLDGIHARKTKQTSKLGEILDHGLDPLRGILVIKMFFDILKINDNSILFLFSLCFNLFLLTAKYSNKYLYGTKYISIDDFGILQIIATLFINKIDPTIIKNNINLIKYVIGFLILVQLSYLYKFKITKTDIFIFLLVNYISYLNTNNLTNLLLINFIYPVYTIL